MQHRKEMSKPLWYSEGMSDDNVVRRRSTMRDVAALAGVGLKTVSRVVNDEPGVSAELSERVRRAARQLDYLPNLAAGHLRRSGGRTATLGAILQNVANPFSSGLQRAIQDVAARHDVEVFSGSVEEDAARERHLVATFAARRVDGLALVPASHDHSYLLAHKRAGMSVVFMDRPPEHLDCDAIVVDNRAGSERAVCHLITGGHRRIAYLGDLGSVYTARERFAGYADALRSAGISLDPELVRHDLLSSESAEGAVAGLLAAAVPPTAIFASQNLVTIGAVRALRRAGLQHRVALVGFDDFALADLIDPAITVVAQDSRAIGTRAAELLFARMDGDQSPTSLHVIPTLFIRRGSGEIRPVP
jgi:LacI family transcriptional regulator